MNFIKKMCILRQVRQGFSGDGKTLSGLIKIEQYGKNLSVEVSVINFAPLSSGEYYCLLSDRKGRTEMLPLRGKSLFNIVSELNAEEGFCGVICFVKNGIIPIAYGVNGDNVYDWRTLVKNSAPAGGKETAFSADNFFRPESETPSPDSPCGFEAPPDPLGTTAPPAAYEDKRERPSPRVPPKKRRKVLIRRTRRTFLNALRPKYPYIRRKNTTMKPSPRKTTIARRKNMNASRMKNLVHMHTLKAEIRNKQRKSGRTLQRMEMLRIYAIRLKRTPTDTISPSREKSTLSSQNTLRTRA